MHMHVAYAAPSSPTPGIARAALDALPANPGRSSKVHNLVKALGLLDVGCTGQDGAFGSEYHNGSGQRELPRAKAVETGRASRKELEMYHDHAYVEFILREDPHSTSPPPSPGSPNNSSCESEGESEGSYTASKVALEAEVSNRSGKRLRLTKESEYGLEDDCPTFPLLPTYVRSVAGASLEMARLLRDGEADVAIAWDGGRHHCQRGAAKGFCYINDAVLACLKLCSLPSPEARTKGCKRLDRVMYIDIDIHHGDGVEAAFYSTHRTLTLSLHLHAPSSGYFPLTGALSSSGPLHPSPAASHALNGALHPYLCTDNFKYLWEEGVEKVLEAYNPGAVVIQCGLDGLAGDPSGSDKGGWSWGLDLEAYRFAVERVCSRATGSGFSDNRKVLLLGGGGYHSTNAAKGWAYLTSVALGRTLPLDTPIPPTVQNYETYGPSYTLDVPGLINTASDENGTAENSDSRIRQVVLVLQQHAETLANKYRRTTKLL